MRSIYLLIAFIAATTFFFYAFGSFTGQSHLLNNGNLTNNFTPTENQPAGANSIGKKGFSPANFGGPSGQPHIIGPSSQPPNY